MQEDFLSNRSAELFKYFMVRLQNLLPLILRQNDDKTIWL